MADQFTDAVRAALRDEVADVTAAPDLLATVRRRHHHRGRLGRRFGIAVPVLAAAAAAAVVLAPGDPAHQPPDVVVAEPANAAQVKQQVTAALDQVEGGIVYERAVVTEGEKYSEPGQPAVYERWQAADGSTFRLLVTIDGEPVVDLSRDRVSDVFVDYRTHSYRAFAGTEMNSGTDDDVWTPAEIKQAIADRLIVVVGPGEPVNGRPTITMRRVERKVDPEIVLWVDADTYLPVRWAGGQSAPFDITWLPATADNNAKLTTTIPDGYRREN